MRKRISLLHIELLIFCKFFWATYLCSQKGVFKGAMHSLHTAFVLTRFEPGR